MALEDYVRGLSYLTSGVLSDLTLKFEDKSWHIHKALVACHSKWFQKALTIGMEETNSGTVSLKDDPVYGDAIGCMVTYFYTAGYNASGFKQSAPLIHAQVVIIADKYDCACLYKLAKTLFMETILSVSPEDWAIIAAFIYNQTTIEASAHVDLRKTVVVAVADRERMLQPTLREMAVVDLLNSNAELATDLLVHGRYGPKAEKVSEHHFVCEHCQYSHAGSTSCPFVTKTNKPVCPRCGSKTGNPSHYTRKVYTSTAFPCHSCHGYHTVDPDNEDDEDDESDT